MAKFKNLKTGMIEETDNKFVIDQMRKYPDTYEEVKGAKGKAGKDKIENGEDIPATEE